VILILVGVFFGSAHSMQVSPMLISVGMYLPIDDLRDFRWRFDAERWTKFWRGRSKARRRKDRQRGVLLVRHDCRRGVTCPFAGLARGIKIFHIFRVDGLWSPRVIADCLTWCGCRSEAKSAVSTTVPIVSRQVCGLHVLSCLKPVQVHS
jgi:hypothetical protein